MKKMVVYLFPVALCIGLATSCKQSGKTQEGPEGDTLVRDSLEMLFYVDESLTKAWSSEPVFKVPESVKFDPEGNQLYVANINGNPSEKNGDGFISRLGMDGNVVEAQWATGLNAPKGMGIHAGFLYVTDIDRVVKIEMATGAMAEAFEVPGATFLNDIDIDGSGNVYVSDSGDSTIYRISGGEIALWIRDGRLKGPNGLYVHEDYLLIGASGQVWRTPLEEPAPEAYIGETGGIDGIEWVEGETFVISDWQGNVHLVNPGKEKKKLLDSTPASVNAADIEFIPGEQLLLVPTFFDNRVFAYRLSAGDGS